MNIKKLDKYQSNLILIGDKVISYETHVATLNHATREVVLEKPGKWSNTTSKHINYVATYYGYTINKSLGE